MGETGELQGQDPEEGKRQEQKSYKLKLRGPLFDYIADKLAPVYSGELAALKKDGAYAPIKEFFSSPFGMLMTKIMNVVEESPKRAEIVELEIFQDEYEVIPKKIPEGNDYLSGRIRREMMEELRSGFGDAKLKSRLKDAVSSIKNKLQGKKS
jgi:hypothetical protein